MKTKLLAEMIFGMVIHGIGTKTQIIERIASEIDAHHEPVSGSYKGKAWLGRCFADDGWPLEEDPTNENFEAALNSIAGEDE